MSVVSVRYENLWLTWIHYKSKRCKTSPPLSCLYGTQKPYKPWETRGQVYILLYSILLKFFAFPYVWKGIFYSFINFLLKKTFSLYFSSPQAYKSSKIRISGWNSWGEWQYQIFFLNNGKEFSIFLMNSVWHFHSFIINRWQSIKMLISILYL